MIDCPCYSKAFEGFNGQVIFFAVEVNHLSYKSFK